MSLQKACILSAGALALSINLSPSFAIDSHEHGHSTINLVAEENLLFIEFESPAANLIGFEHKAETDDQQAAIDKAKARLLDFHSIITISAEANCQIAEKSANWVVDSDHGDHAEYHSSYQLNCDLAKLEKIDINLFDHFPGIEEIDAQILFPGIQLALELDSQNRSIQLR